MTKKEWELSWFLTGAVFIARILQMATLTLDGLLGYGDFLHFFQLAKLKGLPYINYWVEFPPFFPFVLKVIFWMSGGRDHNFYYILGFLLAIVCSASVMLFAMVYNLANPNRNSVVPLFAYCFILISLPYNGWYFDPIPVLFLLSGIYYGLIDRRAISVFSISIGVLFKWFPLAGALISWERKKIIKCLQFAALTLSVALLIYGAFWLINPEFTMSSIKAQGVKGSWETVWALFDGNYQTGSFGDLAERVLPLNSATYTRQPSKVSPWLTLILFLGLGIWGLFKSNGSEALNKVAAVGWGLTLLFLWSPGWSPQWILYLIPLVLLTFPKRLGLLYSLTLIGVNILEWPILLSRGWFWSLNYTIPIRFIILVLLAYAFYDGMKGSPGRVSLPIHQTEKV